MKMVAKPFWETTTDQNEALGEATEKAEGCR